MRIHECTLCSVNLLCLVLVCPDTIGDKPEWPMQECYVNFTQHWKGILRNRVYDTFVGS